MEFDSSRKAFFESHNLEAKELPLIFHKDYICRNAERGNWHPNIEFLLVLEGEGMCTVGAENLEMHPGDLIAINSNQLHIIHSNSRVVYHCLILDSDFCMQNNIPTEKLYYQTMIHSEEANRLFLVIVAELEKEQPFQIAGIKCAVLQFLLFLSRNFLEKGRSVHAVHTAEDENMKLAIGYIQSHLQEKLSLEKICGEAGLSKFYFIRQFKKTTGMTPIAFINSLRCEDAKKLLLHRKASVHEIALQCGFENDSYFSKVFKEYSGVLPTEFRSRGVENIRR